MMAATAVATAVAGTTLTLTTSAAATAAEAEAVAVAVDVALMMSGTTRSEMSPQSQIVWVVVPRWQPSTSWWHHLQADRQRHRNTRGSSALQCGSSS